MMAAALAAVGSLSVAHAVTPGDTIKNFTLKDFNGKTHELYKLSDKSAIVFMVQGNGCPIVRLAVPPLRDVRDQYQKHDVEFFLLNTNLQDTPDAVKAESNEFGFNFPIWMDRNQKIGEALGITRTAEVFVVDPKTWKLKYHGPIDDRLSYEKQHPVQHHYLTDALDAVLAGKPVAVAEANSPGCLINFPNRSQIL
jgi:peroxiredoxin